MLRSAAFLLRRRRLTITLRSGSMSVRIWWLTTAVLILRLPTPQRAASMRVSGNRSGDEGYQVCIYRPAWDNGHALHQPSTTQQYRVGLGNCGGAGGVRCMHDTLPRRSRRCGRMGTPSRSARPGRTRLQCRQSHIRNGRSLHPILPILPYATDDPSIRYSPYSAILATIATGARVDAWHVLSGAAVANTLLLGLALWILLKSFQAQRIAVSVLIAALLVYGASPGYANSLALADLPWHQVNPSAFALSLVLFVWSALRWADRMPRRAIVGVPLCAGLFAIAMLSHAMTGVVGAVGMFAMALSADATVLVGATAALSIVIGLGLAALWPLYPFLKAVTTSPDSWYWYNPYILQMMVTTWCLPCFLCSLLALPWRAERLVRFALWGLATTVVLTSLAVVVKSATLARLPLAGLVFCQLLAGFVFTEWRVLSTATWGTTLLRLRSTDLAIYVPAFIRLLLLFCVIYFAWPQLNDLARQPHLLRPWLPTLLPARDLQTHRLRQYREVLAPVGEQDVVIADLVTAWPVPSVKGRIVGALHLEYFTLNQRQRWDDVEAFFSDRTTMAERMAIMSRYDVRWILLDRKRNAGVVEQFTSSLDPPEGNLLLLDAERVRRHWMAR